MTPVYPAAGHDPYSWLLPPSGNLVRCVQGIQWPERIVEGFPEDAMSELKKVFVERVAALYSHKERGVQPLEKGKMPFMSAGTGCKWLSHLQTVL